MKTSTEIGSFAKRIGEERAVYYVAESGFDAWDFSMMDMCRYDYNTKSCIDKYHPLQSNDYLKFARKLKQIGVDNGIVCNQSHAPFPSMNPKIRTYLKRAIECTAEAGGEICIIHPDNDSSAEENAELYSELLPFAKECGVKIAAENMWNWNSIERHPSPAACSTAESYLAHLRAVNDPFFVACLDTSHAEMIGSGAGAAHMIRALGSHLQALHLSDSDHFHDSHQLPMTMDIDFKEIIIALKEINYQGYLTLEADKYLASYETENILKGLRCMYESVRKLADMFEN